MVRDEAQVGKQNDRVRALVGPRIEGGAKTCGAGQRLCMGRLAYRFAAGRSCALSSTMRRLPGRGERMMSAKDLNCVFCKIIAKQIPATVIHEDEHTLAFMDIGQVNPGHALV